MHYLSFNKTLIKKQCVKNGQIQNAVILSKSIFTASNVFMQIFNVSTSCTCMQSTFVSECFSKSCSTSWSPHIYTIFAPLRITKVNNANRISPKPLIFYYKGTSYQYQCVCKVWWIFIIAFSRYKGKTKVLQTDRRQDRQCGNSIPPQTQFAGGIIAYLAINTSRLMSKPTKWHVHPAKTQISLGIHPVWSVFIVRMKKAGP